MIIKAIAAAVAATAAVVGTVSSIKAQKKQAKANKRAAKFERQKSELQSARQKIDAIRAGRSAAAEVSQAAENQGVAGSSIGQGGTASVVSQMNSNLSFLDQYGFFSDMAGRSMQKAADAGANASMWAGIAQLGSQVYEASGGFTGPTPPAAPKK